MGKVINLRDAAFNRLDKTPHATTVYIHNMTNNEGLTQAESKPQNKTTMLKGFIPFGTPIPRDWTLAGKMDNIKTNQGKK